MDWKTSKGVARGILHDRSARRKVMTRLLVLALALMACGLWVVDAWLMGSAVRFLLWWGACALVTTVTMLFAVYDMLAVVREERDR